MTDAEMIQHLWTHRTQDHPVFSDEELKRRARIAKRKAKKTT